MSEKIKTSSASSAKDAIKTAVVSTLHDQYNVTPENASDKQFYEALSGYIVSLLKEKRRVFEREMNSKGKKQVYYLSMEFLMGRSLKTSLSNLGLIDSAKSALKDLGVVLENLYELEPDAGLGNGGLGRLAACYLDGLATQEYLATGYSILYEYGIFRQKIEDGWQIELPDYWLPGGSCWLVPQQESQIEIKFDGNLKEYWDNQYHCVTLDNYTTVMAVPYDMYVSGFDSKGVSNLRLWKAVCPSFDMATFNRGDYASALSQNIVAQAISKVLYPNDNHHAGKSLRLRQQYFLCAASIGDIVSRHMSVYGTLDNLAQKVAIQINDTHPTLAIPELMRILLDDCGYTWDSAWDIVSKTFAYTNHTVMAEALEKWDANLMKSVIPRIYSIIVEINNRYCAHLREKFPGDEGKVAWMSIIKNNMVHMANLCVAGSHSVNGVSKIHSEIIKEQVFKDEYLDTPEKFKNVTNGIAYRRWLYQSNPALTKLLEQTIGDGFLKDGSKLLKFRDFADDSGVLSKLATVKKQNKESFAKYVKNQSGTVIDPHTIFDVQVKRLHEYKRQHLNALNIIADYICMLETLNADSVQKTYIFAAKAAPGYYLAKQIIKLIWNLGEEIRKNPSVNKKLNVVFLENYCVSLSELLMPASEISEQISLAGTEASGTGNMKLMLNGAITLGTMDGANVEIYDMVGKDNILTFGMSKDEVNALKPHYRPSDFYNSDPVIKAAVDKLTQGINSNRFDEIANSLKGNDPYMVLADFADYRKTQRTASELYLDTNKWQKMSLYNISGAGIFSADRAVEEYAKNIWGLEK